MTASLLSPQEFLNQLIERLSGGDRLVLAAIDEYDNEVKKYGSDEAFAQSNRKLYNYLEIIMHKSKDLNTRIEGIEYFTSTDRVPKYEYLLHAVETFEEAHLRFKQIFDRSKEFAATNPEFEAESQNMLKALSVCVDFAKEQYAIVAPKTHARHP